MKLCCAVLLRLGLKGVKVFWNVSKVCMHGCWSNWHPNLWSNLNSKKLLGRETPSCGFNRVGPKGGQNSLKCRESWRACLSIPYASKHINSKNVVEAETASCSFVRVWLKDGGNSSQHRESWHTLLFSKCGFKSMIKIQFWELSQTCNFVVRFF